MPPIWLHVLAIISLISGVATAVVIAVDVGRRPQHMAVMNVVWPVTALYGGVLALWFYFRHGRAAAKAAAPHSMMQRHTPPAATSKSFPIVVAIGDTHCGAGCTLGDIIAESLAFFYPTIAIWFGWKSIFADKMYAVWIFDFILAFVLGIMFQYFAIVPMRGLSFREGVLAALKADTMSLTAWLTATATPSASAISSFDAPRRTAASLWTAMQPSHRAVTATAKAISSRIFAPSKSVF